MLQNIIYCDCRYLHVQYLTVRIFTSTLVAPSCIGKSHSPVSVNLCNGEYELFSHIFNNNACIKQALLLSGYRHKLGSVTAFPFKPSCKRIKINICCQCTFPKWQPVLGSEAGSERVGEDAKVRKVPEKGWGSGKEKKQNPSFPQFPPALRSEGLKGYYRFVLTFHY